MFDFESNQANWDSADQHATEAEPRECRRRSPAARSRFDHSSGPLLVTDPHPPIDDVNTPIRHLVFVRAASQLPEDSSKHTALLAGFQVLRLLDKWPRRAESPNDLRLAQFGRVRDAVVAVDDGLVRRVLADLLDAIRDFARGLGDSRATKLIVYARLLDEALYWELAADAYAVTIEVIGATERDSELLPQCYQRAAHAMRQIDQLDLAHQLLVDGIKVASAQHEVVSEKQRSYWLGRLRISEAIVRGQRSEREANWSAAADAYVSAVELITPWPSERPQLPLCYERAAYCMRQIGQIERSEELLHDGIEVSTDLNDPHWLLDLRISSALVERQKGDLLEAEFELEKITRDAESANQRELVARATHERGLVALERKQFERAAELCYAAARLYDEPRPVRRALCDVALALSRLGLIEYANKAYLVARRAPGDGLESRALAGLNLFHLAVRSNDRSAFDRLYVDLGTERMSGHLLTHYHFFAGLGFRKFGDAERARTEFDLAISLAEASRVTKLLVQADAALAATDEDRTIAWKPAEGPGAEFDALLGDIDAERGLFAAETE